MTSYVYTALPNPRKYMRLLKLFPSSDPEPERLRAEVILCLREEAPAYEPLSYTWGQQDASCSIWLRDTGNTAWKPFSIRPNLESCLKHLRQEEARILWVDAICINQDDNAEKGHQVATMDLVYRSQSLLIWLGESSANSEVAIDLFRSFATCLSRDWHEVSAPLSDQDTEAVAEFIQSQTDETWAAFLDLIKRPWFTRRWVVQEVVLSHHKLVHLGSASFCFAYLSVFCAIFRGNPYHSRRELSSSPECRRAHGDHYDIHDYPAPPVDPVDNVLRLWEMHKLVNKGDRSSLTLERLLENFSAFDSFDVRDGVYAFLSMASDINTEEWIFDYSVQATTTELYAIATFHIIQNTKKLDIVCRRIQQLSFAKSVHHLSCCFPWYGLQTVIFTSDHSHRLHSHRLRGYNTKSLTTFGQPLSTVRIGQVEYLPETCLSCKEPHCQILVCAGCDRKITGTGYRCIDCERFDFCYKCISTAKVNHTPTHRFEIHNNAVYFASSYYIMDTHGLKYHDPDCSAPNHVLVLPVGAVFVDTIRDVGSGGDIKAFSVIVIISLPWEDWKNLDGMDEIGLDNDRNANAAFLRTLVVFGVRAISDESGR
ncbi:hypothetical protein HER10_EVM0012939 [Colletotrichum scovillei]|uniref:uncharacterized protein n=1 Tax=Colletotrichum scovillei TaxID=1209932 RepID=UPI0015C381BC|nr:uncharacterized protein HER10_EVM0012939 [Colletotrichum scovillei]KAF4781509.1 hypothetical protein HER10_EVM0012939 [Colletotrichum scovillei]